VIAAIRSLVERQLARARRVAEASNAPAPLWYLLTIGVKCFAPISESTLSTERVERRLTAILAADVAGYSRLTGVDEEGTQRDLPRPAESGVMAGLRQIKRDTDGKSPYRRSRPALPTIGRHRTAKHMPKYC